MFGYLQSLFLNKHVCSLSASAAQAAEAALLWGQEANTNQAATAGTGTTAGSSR